MMHTNPRVAQPCGTLGAIKINYIPDYKCLRLSATSVIFIRVLEKNLCCMNLCFDDVKVACILVQTHDIDECPVWKKDIKI